MTLDKMTYQQLLRLFEDDDTPEYRQEAIRDILFNYYASLADDRMPKPDDIPGESFLLNEKTPPDTKSGRVDS